MRRGLRKRVVFVSAVIVGTLVLAHSRSQSAVNGVLQEECSTTLAGWQYPAIVPDYMAWEALFEDATSDGFAMGRLSPAAIAAVRSQAPVALKTATRGRGSVSTNSRLVAADEAQYAVEVLLARDELIRSLPEAEFLSISHYLQENSARRLFALPARGVVVKRDVSEQCAVSVRGREHPHLIPEVEYWRFNFQTLAMAAQGYRLGPKTFAPEHIGTVQRSELPIPATYLNAYLELATATTEQVKRLGRDQATDGAVAIVVLSARAAAVREFPREVWAAIEVDAHRTRSGFVFTFPAAPISSR